MPNIEESMTELTNGVEIYWEKWEAVRMGNKKILIEADTTVKNTGSGAQAGSGTVSSDTRPSFLECESSMLDVLSWIE